MPDQGQEKTEQPTSHKLEEARKEGNVFQSRDIATLAVLGGTFFVLSRTISGMSGRIGSFLVWILDYLGTSGTLQPDRTILMRFLATAAICALPIMLTAMVIGIVAHGVQTKFLFVGKLARPKASRLNPLQGLKRMFSLRNLVELIKNIVKIVFLFVIGYSTINSSLSTIARMQNMAPANAAAALWSLIMDLVARICLAFAAIAAADFLFQRYQYRRDMMMTKQEVKEEFKMLEGNPEIKNRIRRIQREMSQRRMMQDVPKADVVIRNPTHVAVALKYDPKYASAPYVVARGLDNIALKIVETAEEAGVPSIENKPLARGLYRNVDIGQPILQEYFGAVAEILVMIYRQEGREDMFGAGDRQ